MRRIIAVIFGIIIFFSPPALLAQQVPDGRIESLKGRLEMGSHDMEENDE